MSRLGAAVAGENVWRALEKRAEVRIKHLLVVKVYRMFLFCETDAKLQTVGRPMNFE